VTLQDIFLYCFFIDVVIVNALATLFNDIDKKVIEEVVRQSEGKRMYLFDLWSFFYSLYIMSAVAKAVSVLEVMTGVVPNCDEAAGTSSMELVPAMSESGSQGGGSTARNSNDLLDSSDDEEEIGK
jgi:hypothetical protein